MKTTYVNSRLFILGVLSTLFLNCNMLRAAAFFDPLAGRVAPKSIYMLHGEQCGDLPCIWGPDPIPVPTDPGPGAPDCVGCVACVAN